ncbi:uncharacterized protein Bfra_003508 [Botrytis fragariae]|uniref:Uncharacterized protein n=1 Tax=Botrytis fragariae TaxID=1964551 RepID=A0A8H6EK16_9HELO|nr:uncharacterized protein Bfra_003508 [Botrytis fragariae]KAF5875054.1 hypothetical protein Bfra_003508 [Botrytis fragariae]
MNLQTTYHRWCLSYSAAQILRYFAPQFVTGKRVNTHPNFQYGHCLTEGATIRQEPQILSEFSSDLHDYSITFNQILLLPMELEQTNPA